MKYFANTIRFILIVFLIYFFCLPVSIMWLLIYGDWHTPLKVPGMIYHYMELGRWPNDMERETRK